ncbi:MAG TPA: DUF5667 domain-containing protein [Candidatus Portnoybacteria bacterium]|nr:DUF5667 domain-containing protein [Candidatus Portnoybacteria bacterium]MDD5752436.1 DUF5667 domain-containing protein [Candidatus Portnoybacteria bacterium]HPM28554.1 DUF5667 domain-containing protein [Candidatus Portnoybacteria bacterium]
MKKVRPSSSLLNSQRSFLLSEIAYMQKTFQTPQISQTFQVPQTKRKTIFGFPVFNISRFLKPAFALAMFLVVLTSSLGTVGAISVAQNSLPGDFLYGLKTTFEDTQMTFAGTEESKVKLSMKFAGQRVDEIAQIAGNPEKKNNVEQTVKNFTEQLIVAQNEMNKLKISNSEKAVEIAKLVNKQTITYKESLIKTSEQLAYMMPEERTKIETEIDQALVEVNKVQEKSDKIINPIEETKTEIINDIIVPVQEEKTESDSITVEEIIIK